MTFTKIPKYKKIPKISKNNISKNIKKSCKDTSNEKKSENILQLKLENIKYYFLISITQKWPPKYPAAK